MYDDVSHAVVGFSVYENLEEDKLSAFINQIVAQEPYLKYFYKSIKIYSAAYFNALIPDSLFEAKSVAQYLSHISPLPDKTVCLYDYVKSLDAFNVYAIKSKVFKTLNEVFIRPKIFDLHTVCIQNITRENKGTRDKLLHVHLLDKNTLLFYFCIHGKLILNNQFEIENDEDFVYYILAVCDQLQHNIDSVQVILSGDIQSSDTKYELAQQYIPKIAFAKHPKGIYFPEPLQTLASHTHYDIFSLSVCE